MNLNTSTESRALTLLGQGIAPEIVANSLGVSPSRISQLISDPEFAAQVADLRFQNLSKHNARDAAYDALEDDLLERMKNCLPMMYKPVEILKAIQVINQAKRRGQSTPDSIIQQQTIINLTLPTQIINNFKVNAQKQVTQIGSTDLITMQASTLLNKVKGNSNGAERPALPHSP
jgi:hypothetical protein